MAKTPKPRTDLKAVQNGPILAPNLKGIFSIYFKGKSKNGVPMARRVPLHTNNEASAQTKFDIWKRENGFMTDVETTTPAKPGTSLVVHSNAQNDDVEKEAKRAKFREYYYAAKERKAAKTAAHAEDSSPPPVKNSKPRNGNGHANGAPDPAIMGAVMQQLTSTLQSMATSIKLLSVVLGTNQLD